jgi:dihydroneopterin aldolase
MSLIMGERGTIEQRVCVKGLRLYGPLGLTGAERAAGTVMDLDLEVRLAPVVGFKGELDQTVDYAALCRLSQAEAACEHVLLESLALGLAAAILDRWPAVDGVWLRIVKPAAPVDLPVESLGCTLSQVRPGAPPISSGS